MSVRKKPSLGRGLDSLLGGGAGITDISSLTTSGGSSIANVSIELIEPNKDQPRRDFDEERMTELAESIKHIGLVQPITVQAKGDGRYLIISGERRYRAAKQAGLTELPVYIREASDDEVLEMALVENIQREDLNAIEIALTYQQLAERLGLTHEALAERVGKKRATISNYLRLLRLPAPIQLGLSERQLEMGHARALLQVSDTERQLELYQLAVREHLSVREVEELANAMQLATLGGDSMAHADTTASKRTYRQPAEYKVLEQHLGSVFASKVSLKCSSKGRGRITIPFDNDEDLERIIQLLERIQQT